MPTTTMRRGDRTDKLRDFCRPQNDDRLVWCFQAIDRMIPGTLGDDRSALVLSRAALFAELDDRGVLDRVEICQGCYVTVDVLPCECEMP